MLSMNQVKILLLGAKGMKEYCNKIWKFWLFPGCKINALQLVCELNLGMEEVTNSVNNFGHLRHWHTADPVWHRGWEVGMTSGTVKT